LLQVVDGGVFQHIARQVVADLLDDLVAEAVARLVQLHKIERLAHGLQRLGELGREQVFQDLVVGRARAANALGHAQHVFGGLVDAHEELDLDVGADVVLADQALVAGSVDLDGLDRDVHQLGLVDDGVDHAAGEGHLGLGAQRVDDERVALLHLAVELGEQCKRAQDEEHEHANGDQDEHQGFGHGALSVRKGLKVTMKKEAGRWYAAGSSVVRHRIDAITQRGRVVIGHQRVVAALEGVGAGRPHADVDAGAALRHFGAALAFVHRASEDAAYLPDQRWRWSAPCG
jgi:hypothetical protein